MSLDPHVLHLLDLLDLLPGSDAPLWRYFGEETGVGDDWPKLAVANRLTMQHLERVRRGEEPPGPVAQACLYLFDGERPELWEELLGQLDLGYIGIDGPSGPRRWCADLCATAWEIHIPRQAVK